MIKKDNTVSKDGPTSIYRKDRIAQNYYNVNVLHCSTYQDLQHLEETLYEHCNIHFINSTDCIEIKKRCKIPITIFALSPDFYFTTIDEDNDYPNYYIGIIPKNNENECYFLVRGMDNFMRIMICYPLFAKELGLSQSYNQTTNYSQFIERRDSLLHTFKLMPISLEEWHLILTDSMKCLPLKLEEQI